MKSTWRNLPKWLITSAIDQCAEDSAGSYEKHKCPKSNMLGDTNAIKNGVMQVGSAETGFYVYQDFLQYKSGIYKHDPSTGNNPLGGHAVRIGLGYWPC